ncbi:unnamed protein product, partial [Musa textilis]
MLLTPKSLARRARKGNNCCCLLVQQPQGCLQPCCLHKQQPAAYRPTRWGADGLPAGQRLRGNGARSKTPRGAGRRCT